MKKILLILAAALVLIGGGYSWYHARYGGTSYYVKIREDGEVVKLSSDGGQQLTRYNYKMNGLDSKGKKKELEFMSHHNLRHEAYLKVLNNNKKGVISWEEVQRNDIPEKVLSKI